MNPTVLPTDALSSFPPAISSIPSGGGEEPVPFPVPEYRPWEPPSSWPNLRDLVSNDTEDYAHKIYVLWDTNQSNSISNIFNLFYTTEKVVSEDGDVYTENAHHVWSNYGTGNRYRWTAHYSSSPWTKISMGRLTTISDKTAKWIVANTPFSSSAANCCLFTSQYLLESVEFPYI